MALHVIRLNCISDLVQEKDHWERHLEQSSCNSVFLCWEWILTWYEHRCPVGAMWLLKVVDTGTEDVVGYAPLFMRTKRCWGMRIRELRLAGSDAACAEYLGVVATRGREGELGVAVWEYLQNHRMAWDCIRLTDMPEGSTLNHARALHLLAEHKHIAVYTGVARTCLVRLLPSSWDMFLASLGKKRRDEFKYYEKRLRDSFTQIEFSRVTGSDEDISVAMVSLMDLHQASWRHKGMCGAFSSSSMRIFHHGVAIRMRSVQRLALYCLKLNNVTVGLLYGFEYNGTFYYYNSGFDPSYKEYSIGLIMVKRVLEECIRRNLTEFDFLRGQSPYKFKYKPLVHVDTHYLEVRQQKTRVSLAYSLQTVKGWPGMCVRRLLPTAVVASMANTINKWRSLSRRYE